MTRDSINDYILRNFSEKRRVHTYAVRDLAVKLALHYGEDPEKAETAALFHDLFRGVPAQALNYYVKELSLPDRYLDNPNLAHGKIAAVIMKRDYGITDEDVLNAVRYHTTGRAGMSGLEMILYLADAIEPNRSYPGVEALRGLAFDGLEGAVCAALAHSLSYIKERGLYLDPDTELALRDLEQRKEMVDE